MTQSDIGLLGLAVMGQNLARNIASRGFKVSVYNRTTETMNTFIDQYGSTDLVGQVELKDFVNSITSPRKIILMVQAGKPVDAVIDSLTPLLDKGDTIIDCGNSHFPDTIRREAELSTMGFNFFGCGVSGGEEGALRGPSLMPGGNKQVWENLEPIFTSIAAKDFSGNPCVTYLGENGAGHYVKMVHNGIEYAVMQMMAEAYDFLCKNFGLSAPEIADIFEQYNQGKLQSFLFEIAVPILRQTDDLADGFLLDKILDKAGQKGTGRWTAIEGLERGVDISTIIQAVHARTVSSRKEFRTQLSSQYKNPSTGRKLPEEALPDIIPELESALYAGMLVAYAQGFDLLRQAAEEMNWELNYAEVARIWEGGCIIRAQILNTLHEAFEEANNAPLWTIEAIVKDLQDAWLSLRAISFLGTQSGTPLFCLGAALSSLEAITEERNSANFIQALRDSFGAHTYKRIDREGTFHTEWGE
ncbi:NADP-dependent phosphogluconate dehydrogenase [Candidatus Peregrinibacteria bacterium]|nr:NADP-dependent phosphogluconate dehydrogenase [bacterium]NCQ55828.1 NADP-dependent phosphogluconate dehydrogenase [Candidatus Parcubacteria bacterium]NCS67895.1 NADP-dependent phosphogluconate dehydrogenase [Candidatus Peregrinibacteria bacterium]